jgi:hypothetical protein
MHTYKHTNLPHPWCLQPQDKWIGSLCIWGRPKLEKKPVHICPKASNVAGSSTRMKFFVSLAYFSLSEDSNPWLPLGLQRPLMNWLCYFLKLFCLVGFGWFVLVLAVLGGWTQSLALVKQAFCHLSHSTSSIWTTLMIPPQLLKLIWSS